MKRLVRKAEEQPMMEGQEGMTQMNELDEADIRHDRCPTCKNYPLERQDGFKHCPKCSSTYKMFNGAGYILAKK